MSQRITRAMLDKRVSYLNTVAGTPQEPWSGTFGTCEPNPGNYHLDGAYGGYSLSQMALQGSGERNVLNAGFNSIPVTYELVNAYIAGMLDAQHAQRMKSEAAAQYVMVYGKRYRVTGIYATDAEANAHMEAHPQDACLIAHPGVIVLANKDDKGI